jgi:hypothetical protein
MLFQGKEEPTGDLKHHLFGRDPTHSILTTSAQPERVQKINESSEQLHLPAMH